MYAIDGIEFKDYGLYVSDHKGQANLLDPKKQFFTVYGSEGYQISKRKGNILSIFGYIIADDLNDFVSKTSALRTLFSYPGTREIVFDNENLTCFNMGGFKIDRVRMNVSGSYGRFKIQLVITDKTSSDNVSGFAPLLNIGVIIQEPAITTNAEIFSAPVMGLSVGIIEPIITTV